MSRFFKESLPLLFILLIVASSCSNPSGQSSSLEAEIPYDVLRRLNATITKAPIYQKKKVEKIDSLKNLLKAGNQPSRQWEVLLKIASLYRQMNADSSIFYAQKSVYAIPADDNGIRLIKSELATIMALSTAGIFPPAIQRLDSISKLNLPHDARIEFWKTSRMLYSYMLAFVQDHGEYSEIFRKKYIQCDDSLLSLLPHSDPFRQFIFSERLASDAKWETARKNLETILREQPKESNIYAMAAFQLAFVNMNLGNPAKYVEYLALSAESDIKQSVKEGIALPTLAYRLYEMGDIDDAFKYINFALEEANSSNIRMRMVSISAFMPLIDEAYRKKINDSNNKMLAYLLISTTLLIIALILSTSLIRNIRDSRAKEKKLATASKKLEAYVGNFIGLCSNYASRLDQFGKLITRKINARQTDDLLKLVSSGRFNEEDNDEFYRLIDKAILDLFPDFVDNINTLLMPDQQIALKPDMQLSPELRIYAFVRLGVDQSNKIAQILNYSSNTVYSYRNRMRNRAFDRDNFDKNVAELGYNN